MTKEGALVMTLRSQSKAWTVSQTQYSSSSDLPSLSSILFNCNIFPSLNRIIAIKWLRRTFSQWVTSW